MNAERPAQLVLQRCRDCAGLQYYPRVVCTHCGSTDLDSQPVAGNGTVYSYTVVCADLRQDEEPYVVAIVELAEGPRLLSRIVDCEPAAVRCDMSVRLRFRAADGQSLAMFAPYQETGKQSC